jgi:hypothetical protein
MEEVLLKYVSTTDKSTVIKRIISLNFAPETKLRCFCMERSFRLEFDVHGIDRTSADEHSGIGEVSITGLKQSGQSKAL